MKNQIKKTKVHEGYGKLLRKELEAYIAEIEGKELTDAELGAATDGFADTFKSLSSRVASGAAITQIIRKVTEPQILDTGKVTEIRFGKVALAAQMIMVAFD
jgi:hypothetical protein